MAELTHDSTVAQTVALLTRYGFEMKGYTATELIDRWLKNYQAIWVRLAVVEALYQGRYKAVSVEQILSSWFRRGNPTYHFNHEFERLICRKLPRYLAALSESEPGSLDKDYRLVSINKEICEASTQLSQFPPESKATLLPAAREQQSVPVAISVSQEQSEALINPDEPVSEPQSEAEEKTAAEDKPEPHVPYETNWSSHAVSQHPIHQFTPAPDVSEFYFKLKAVAQQGLDENSEF
ncbi:MAG: hypothetical protein AB4426_35495 [Xenococcaceae cyanobacterium]